MAAARRRPGGRSFEPFSGGAVLGDRIRANTATSHPNVYMRSLSARASLDSLITTVVDSCAVFARFGFDRVLLETVGAGQMNLEALDLADCVIGVSVPGLGDAVQLSKAGMLEIADIHVRPNKCDWMARASFMQGWKACRRRLSGARP